MQTSEAASGNEWGFHPIGPRTIQLNQSYFESANTGLYAPVNKDEGIAFCIDEAKKTFKSSEISEALQDSFIKWISTFRAHVYDLFENRGVRSALQVNDKSSDYGRNMETIEFQLSDIGVMRFMALHDTKRSDERPCFVITGLQQEAKYREFMGKLSISC